MKKVAFLPQKKTGFETKTKKDTIHKEGHCIMIKGSVHQESMPMIGISSHSNRAAKYMKQTRTEMKGGINSSKIKAKYFNTPLSHYQ